MARKKFSKSTKRGSVLALVLFAVILLFFSGMGILAIGQTVRFFSVRTAADVSARSAADTGITKAIYEMNRRLFNGTWDGKNWLWEFHKGLPNSGSEYSYFVLKANWLYGDIMPGGDDSLINFVNSASGRDGDYMVSSIGRYTTAQRRILAIVRLKGAGDQGVLVRDKLTLKADTLVAGADSRNGPEIDPTVLVEIGTASTGKDKIVLNNNVVVAGNIAVGVGGNVDEVIKDLGGITGLRYSMTEEPEFPYIYPPEISAEFPAWDIEISIPKKDPIDPNDPNIVYITETLADGGDYASGRYTRIDLANNEAVVIKSGNDVVLHLTSTGHGDKSNSISFGVNSQIIIQAGATLNLYVDGDIVAGTGSGFNNEGTPPDLKIWGYWREPLGGHNDAIGGHQVWQLNAKSDYFGQVYAPNAHIIVNAKGDLFGAFTALSFDMRNGGNLIYDGALRDVDPDEQGVRFELKRWYE